jgi:phenolic acid decarboxylase
MANRVITHLRGGATAISASPLLLRDSVENDIVLDNGDLIYVNDAPAEIQNRPSVTTLYGNDSILFLRVFNERQTIYSRISISDFAAVFGLDAPPNRP